MPHPKKSSTPPTYYAYTFDMIGGPYEFNENNTFDPNFEMFPTQTHKYVFTDDSVMTTAVARMVMESDELFKNNELSESGKWSNDDEIIRNGVVNLKKFVKLYPNGNFPGGYGPTFVKWARKEGDSPMPPDPRTGFRSCGNGSGMRVSAVGWAFNTLEQTLHMAELTAMPSHSDPEGIKGAQAIAAAIYLARAGVDKANIKLYLETKFNYDLDKTLEAHRKYNHEELYSQSEVCPTTVPMAIRAFLEGENFEDCGRKAITIGGDSDTIGAMAASIAGAYYGMPKWLEEECDKRLDDTLRNESEAFRDYVESRDTEPNMEEIENALAKARLEKHFLDKYKAKEAVVLKDDTRFVDLLAEKEATRLFYDEVNEIRKKGDISGEHVIVSNKDMIVKNLKEQLKTSEELLRQYDKMTECPVDMVKVIDYDAGKRAAGKAKSIPEARLQIIHESMDKLIPDKLVDNSKYRELMTAEIEKAEDALELKSQVLTRAKEATERYYAQNHNGNRIGTKDTLVNLIGEMIDENGDIWKYFSASERPELLENVLKDLRKLGNSHDYEPINTGDKVMKGLQELSDELLNRAVLENSEALVEQIAFVNRLTEAVSEWFEAPESLRIVAPYEVFNSEAAGMDAYAKQQQDQYEKYTIVGYKTERYYNAVLNDMISDEKLSACFDLQKLPKELKTALECWRNKNPKDALKELEDLADRLNERMLDDDSTELMQQVTYVNHLMSSMEEAVDAPEDPDIDIHDTLYKHLSANSEAISRVCEGIDDKGSKVYELALRAQKGLQNIQTAVADDFMHKRDGKALEALKKGNDYAAIFMYQNMQRFAGVSKLDPDKEPDAQKREAMKEAIKDMQAYLQTFESQDLNVSLEQVKKDKAYMNFEKNLNIFKLEKATQRMDGMLLAYKEAKKEVAVEDLQEISKFKKVFTVKNSGNKNFSLKEYMSGIREIEAITKRHPDNLKMLKECGEAVEALIGYVVATDDKKSSNSAALADNQYASKAVQDIIKKGSLAARKLKEAAQTDNQQTKQTTV